MDMIDSTVREWAARPFVWGETDCAMACLAYVQEATGRTIRVRPTHKTARTAMLLARLNGGFQRYAAAVLKELDCPPTDRPDRGDVGLIDIAGQGQTLCLCLGLSPAGGISWAAKGDCEVLLVRDQVLVQAWKVTACPKP